MKHTQTVAEMIRANEGGHSGDPFQLENYLLGFFYSLLHRAILSICKREVTSNHEG